MLGLSRDLSEHECAVVVRRAHVTQLVRGPGSVRTFWRWKRVVVVDLRPFRFEIPPTDVVTTDRVPLSVTGTLEGRVVDPEAAVVKVVDYKNATKFIAETAIRAALKEWHSAERESTSTRLEATVLETVVPAAQSWGVAVSSASLAIKWPSGASS